MRPAAALVALAAGLVAPPAEPSPARVDFRVRYRDEVSSLRVSPLFALPGEAVDLAVLDDERAYEAWAEAGRLRRLGRHRWRWHAPERSGRLELEIRRVDDGVRMRFAAFVLVPASRVDGEHLDGFRLGRYPLRALGGLPLYRPPRGFVRVDAEDEGVLVSPSFRLGQFLCKQPSAPPRYVVLRERLLHKLELVLDRAREHGIEAETLHVMSGYRTPFYNRLIGNGRFSRHIYGDAADVFVDVRPRDGLMDDLNGDGRIDAEDGRVLAAIVDGIDAEGGEPRLVGGLAVYEATEAHGPFVHIDARGFRARWGRGSLAGAPRGLKSSLRMP